MMMRFIDNHSTESSEYLFLLSSRRFGLYWLCFRGSGTIHNILIQYLKSSSAQQFKMIKFILVALLMLQTTKAQQFLSELAYNNLFYEYDELLKCFLQQKLIKGSLSIILLLQQYEYSWAGTFNKSDPKKVYGIYPQPVHVVVTTFQGIDHSLYGELLAKAVKDQPIKAIWVRVDFKISCNQLKGFLRDAKNAVGPDVTVGIMTTSNWWNQSMDPRQGCPQVPQQYPLYNFQQDFYPFAGWKKAEYNADLIVEGFGCQLPEYQTIVLCSVKPKE